MKAANCFARIRWEKMGIQKQRKEEEDESQSVRSKEWVPEITDPHLILKMTAIMELVS